MKPKGKAERQPQFWTKLIGITVAVAIIMILVFSGVQNVVYQIAEMHLELDTAKSELDEAQRQLNEKSSALDTTQSQLAAKSSELTETRTKLAQAQSQLAESQDEPDEKIIELQVAYILSSELANELTAELAARTIMNCYLYEYVGLTNYILDKERSFTPDQIARYKLYIDDAELFHIPLLSKGVADYCHSGPAFEAAEAVVTRAGEAAGARAATRLANELGLNRVESEKLFETYLDKEADSSESTGERTAELVVEGFADAQDRFYQLQGTNVEELFAKALRDYRAEE